MMGKKKIEKHANNEIRETFMHWLTISGQMLRTIFDAK